MRPPAKRVERDAGERARGERARVADGGRARPAGDVLVQDVDALLQLVRDAPEPAAEDDGDLGPQRQALADRLRCAIELVDQAQAVPSASLRS
jgi:hypothetical protein